MIPISPILSKREKGHVKRKQNWFLILLFFLMTIILVAGLGNFYQQQSSEIKTRKSNELKSIAELKVKQILQWRQERFSDAQILSSSIAYGDFTQRLVNNPYDPVSVNKLFLLFDQFMTNKEYQNILYTTPTGELILAWNQSDQIEIQAVELVQQAASSATIIFGDFYRSSLTDQVYLDIACPVMDEQKNVALVLIIRIDPAVQLFPIIESWPTPSQSAETLIVRREGDQILFLNSLRHTSEKPLSIFIPLTQTEIPAVQAVLGKTGAFEGQDYRGVKVFSEIYPIVGTNWYMISKVDEAELLIEIQTLGKYLLFLVALSILLTLTMAAYVYNRRQRNLFSRLYQAESKRVEAQEETRTTLYSIGDGVITTDANGLITRVNPIAEQLTGWQEKDAIGLPLNTVFHILNELTRKEVESPVVNVLRKGLIIGLANHTLLVAKDGTERPISDSGAPIHDNDGKIIGVVMVFRDQTQERAINKERALLTDSISASLNEIFIFDSKTFKFIFANQGALCNLGYTLDEIKLLTPLDIKPEFPVEEFYSRIQSLLSGEKEKQFFETVHKRANGTFYPVEVRLQLFQHETEQIFLAVIQDITERKQAQAQIDESEKRYRQLFNEMEEGLALHKIVLDEQDKPIDYIFLDVNPAFEKLTGLKKDILFGQKVTEVLPGTESYWIETYGKVAQERIAIKFENYAQNLAKWFSVSAFSPAPGQFATVFTDITEHKINENIILESEQKFRSLFENMAQGVVYQNMDGDITLANKAALDILGGTPEQILGKPLLHPQRHISHENGILFTEGELSGLINRNHGQDRKNIIMGFINPMKKTLVWISTNIVPQFHPGEDIPFQIVTTFEDITERKYNEEKLKQQLAELHRWNAVTLGREKRILELKKEVNQALSQAGYPPKYSSQEDIEING
jgi:PAS domain S-box-containing protein